jgi:Tol biopolymer transport system component
MHWPAAILALHLATLPAVAGMAEVSPAGRIVFHSERTGNGDIYAMDPDGSSLSRLTLTPLDEFTPALSPNGTKVAFAAQRKNSPATAEIMVMNVDGTGRARLTFNSAEDQYPAWSPDGSEIAFSSLRDGGPGNLRHEGRRFEPARRVERPRGAGP